MGFIRFILILVLVYFLFKLLFTWVFGPFLRGYYSQGPQQNKDYGNSGKREGEVTIDFMPKNKKVVNKDKGEYIDYEEIKK